jgi:hypothetical protein
MLPVDGGTARFPRHAFGWVTGFFSGWFAWLSAVCVPATVVWGGNRASAGNSFLRRAMQSGQIETHE